MEYMPDFLLSKERVESLRFQRISLESFHSELTLLIKVFFFVEVGLFFSFEDLRSLLLALVLSLILLIVRYPPAFLVSKLANLKGTAPTITIFYARGLAAAVLAFLPAQCGLSNSLFFLQSISALVIFTNIILTVLFPFLRKT
jgi:NhaP-type Na+/H+ or K+/H+ antiporter